MIFTILAALLACSDYTLSGPSGEPVEDTAEPVAEISHGNATTMGTEFWFGFMENLSLAMNGPPEFAVLVTSEVGASGEITLPATGFVMPFEVAAGTTLEIALPAATYYPMGSDVTADLGLRLTSDTPVDVAVMHYRLFFSDGTLVLPVEELGDHYVVVAAEDWYGDSPSSLLVVATEEQTVVEITPSALTSSLRPAGTPYQVTLDAGQSYQVQAIGDLSGTIVRSADNRRIAVFSGAKQAAVDCSADSHVFDQNQPVTRWHEEYAIVPFRGQGYDPVKVVAAFDDTEVRVNCGQTIRLGAGESARVDIEQASVISANKPVGVAQLNSGQQCNDSGVGDPSLLIHPGSGLHRTSARFRSLDHPLFYSEDSSSEGDYDPPPTGPVHFVNVVVDAGETELVLDGVDVTDQLEILGRWATAQLSVGPGEHRVQATLGLAGSAYGFSAWDAYTYSLGYDCEGCGPPRQSACP